MVGALAERIGLPVEAVVTWAPASAAPAGAARGFDHGELLARAVARAGSGGRSRGSSYALAGPRPDRAGRAERRPGPRLATVRAPVPGRSVLLVDDVAHHRRDPRRGGRRAPAGGRRRVLAVTAAATPPPRR